MRHIAWGEPMGNGLGLGGISWILLSNIILLPKQTLKKENQEINEMYVILLRVIGIDIEQCKKLTVNRMSREFVQLYM